MSILKELLSLLQNNKTKVIIENSSGDQSLSGVYIANTINKTENHYHLDNNKQLRKEFESAIGCDSTVAFKEVLLPIEKLINDGKPKLAIRHFLELISSDGFKDYTRDEKFLVYNGLLNCYVIIEADEDEINKWSIKIEALGEGIKEIHRYYYIKAIWKYNLKDFKISKVLNNQAIKAKPDYMNAVACDYLIKNTSNEISYEAARDGLEGLLKLPDLSPKEIAIVYGVLGDVAYNNQDFELAKTSYKESNDYSPSLTKEIGYAVGVYFTSIKQIKEGLRVDLEDINFTILHEAESLFEDIYNNKTEETLHTIARFGFPYLFNIYSLTAKFERILNVVEECHDYIDYANEDIAIHIVQAQVINKIYDDDAFSHLGEYERIKYKAFYYERCEDFEKGIEIILPAIQDKYSDDKILQLSLLNCLKELDIYEDYIYYYKKFNKKGIDEVLWFNYIEYMDKKGDKDLVVSEIRKIKDFVKNAVIIYELLQLLLKYELTEELDEFFAKVDSGEYRIIDNNSSYVIYQELIHLLRKKDYNEFYRQYEALDLEKLRSVDRWILTINYYTFKGDLSNCGEAYFELFKINDNHDDLLKAVEMKVNANEIPEAIFYIEFMNPMKLEKPEYYYMYSAILLKEKGKLEDAFNKLDEYKEFIQGDLESPYHQFYTGFNMTNGRTDEAVKYMIEYHSKNPNPTWFKTIQQDPEASGEELLNKMEELVGGKRDLTQLNWFLKSGVIGISVYEHLTGTTIEQMLYDTRYPFSKLNICVGDIRSSVEAVKKITNKILVDVSTLIILAYSKGLHLLDSFDEVLISYDSISILKRKESDLIKNISPEILKYIEESLHIKEVPVDVSIKIKGNAAELLPEDTLNCMALSEKLRIPFLNVEISIYREFKLNYIIDLNVLFLYLKENNPEMQDSIAKVKKNLRTLKLDFISFNTDDIVSVFKIEGLEGIKPFIKMGENSDYITFVQVFIPALTKIKAIVSIKEFEEVASYFVQFFDKYLGKTKYYMSNIVRKYPKLKSDFEYIIQNCNILNLFDLQRKAYLSKYRSTLYFQSVDSEDYLYYHLLIQKTDIMNKMLEYRKESYKLLQGLEYADALESVDFQKIQKIMGAVAQFMIQFLSEFGKTEENLENSRNLIEKNLTLNTIEDINYIAKLFEEHRDKIQSKE